MKKLLSTLSLFLVSFNLNCGDSSSNDEGIPTGYVESICGNNIVEGEEECDFSEGANTKYECIKCHKPRNIFVTSLVFSGGEISKISDSICEDLYLKNHDLPSEFYLKPWISFSSNSVSDSIYHSPGLYLNKEIIAYNWNDLVDGTINNLILFDEKGDSSEDTQYYSIWTGTETLGNFSGFNCENWTSSSESNFGSFGKNSVLDENWNYFEKDSCSARKSLYCIESEYKYQ